MVPKGPRMYKFKCIYFQIQRQKGTELLKCYFYLAYLLGSYQKQRFSNQSSTHTKLSDLPSPRLPWDTTIKISLVLAPRRNKTLIQVEANQKNMAGNIEYNFINAKIRTLKMCTIFKKKSNNLTSLLFRMVFSCMKKCWKKIIYFFF